MKRDEAEFNERARRETKVSFTCARLIPPGAFKYLESDEKQRVIDQGLELVDRLLPKDIAGRRLKSAPIDKEYLRRYLMNELDDNRHYVIWLVHDVAGKGDVIIGCLGFWYVGYTCSSLEDNDVQRDFLFFSPDLDNAHRSVVETVLENLFKDHSVQWGE